MIPVALLANNLLLFIASGGGSEFAMKHSPHDESGHWFGYLPMVGAVIIAIIILFYALPSIAQATTGSALPFHLFF